MSARPSPTLARCPICGQDPYWHYAGRTTAKRGRESFIFTGCSHARKIGAERVLDDPKEWDDLERRWTEFFESTLAETTKRWTDAQREAFRGRLLWKNALPGATDPINFPPDSPAQQSNEPTKE